MKDDTLRRTALLIALVAVVFSDVTMGLDFQPGSTRDSLSAGGATSFGSPVSPPWSMRTGDADRLAEGGGPLLLFADDMRPETAAHYADMGLEGYYGGAIPAPGQGAEQWRHEWYRWGTEAERGNGAWNHQAEGMPALRFGDGSTDPGYPAGAVAELVSPIIDLRDVSNVEAEAGMVLTRSGPLDAESRTLIVVEDRPTVLRETVEEALVAEGILDEDRRLDTRTHVQEAAAALRLRHAYGFDGMLRDGGRVEAAYLDPHRGWSEWIALEPEAGALRIGERQVSGRTATDDGTTVGVVLRPGGPHAEVSVGDSFIDAMADSEELVVTVSDGPDGPAVAQTGREVQEPHRYQGIIEASQFDVGRGPWAGFGGDSGGLVESVFNLTAFAGHIVRLRFVTASAESAIPGADTHPGLGWLLAGLEVHGLGTPGMQILGLATPGDSAVVAPDRDFQPAVALHNTFQEPLSTRLHLGVDESAATTSSATVAGVGPLARVILSPNPSFHDLVGSTPAPGRYAIDAWIQAQQEIPTDSVQGTMVEPFSTQSQERFHVLVGTGSGWEVTGVEFKPEGESLRPFFVERGQPGHVYVTLRNLAAVPQELELTGDEAALHPLLLDETLKPEGTLTPDQDEVTLEVSRDISGTLGVPGAETTISYRWGGSLNGGVLRLAVEDAAGDVLAEGDRVLVDAALPPMISEDFGNLWEFHGPDCGRVTEFEGMLGVLRCGLTAEAPPSGEQGGEDPDEGGGLPVGSSGSQAAVGEDGILSLNAPTSVLYLRPFEGPVEDVRAVCEQGAQDETVAGLVGDLSDDCEDLPRLAGDRPTVAASVVENNVLHPDFTQERAQPAVLSLYSTSSTPRFESPPLQPGSRIGDGDPDTVDAVRVVLFVQLGLLPDRDAEEGNTTMRDLNAAAQGTLAPSFKIGFLRGSTTPGATLIPLDRTTAVQKVEVDVPFPPCPSNCPFGQTNADGDIEFKDSQRLYMELSGFGSGLIYVYLDHLDYLSRIEVPVSAGDLAALSGFRAEPAAGHAPLKVTFLGELEAGERELESVFFDPGDGSLKRNLIADGLLDSATGGSINLTHTYFRAGSFQPRLDIQEREGVFLGQTLSVVVERSYGVAVSPVVRARLTDLKDLPGTAATADTQLELIHRGGEGVLRMRALPVGESTDPPARGQNNWTILHEVEYPESDEWVRTAFTLPIERNKSQWIVFDLESGEKGTRGDEWSVAEIRWKAGDVTLGGSDFQVELRPDDGDLTASGSTGLAHLAWRAPGLDAVLQGKTPGLDAVLQLPGPIPLDGVRPTLEFRHWIDTGDRGVALVEVAPAGPIPAPADVGVGAPPLPPGTDPVWQVAAAFHGSFTDNALRPVRIDLSPFLAWEDIHVRFRYQEVLLPTANDGREVAQGPNQAGVVVGRGWFVEEVVVHEVQAAGQTTLHQAGPGFNDYRRANVAVAQDFAGVPLGAKIAGGRLHIDFLPGGESWQFAASHQRNTYRVGPVAVTDPIDLRSTFDPVLSIEHEFLHKIPFDKNNLNDDTKTVSAIENHRRQNVIDLEFQVMRPDGSWPSQWIRATPNHPQNFSASSHYDVDPRTGQPGINGPGGFPPATPFMDHDLPWYVSTEGPPGRSRALQTEFNIGEDNRIAGNIVRFRAHLWQEYDIKWGPKTGVLPDWDILSFDVRERRHFSDVAVKSLAFDAQDRDRIGLLAPDAPGLLGLGSAALLSNDQAAILRVQISNEGIVRQDVRVRLTRESTHDGADATAVLPGIFLAVDGNRLIPAPPNDPGIVRGLAPGEVRDALFRIDASAAPPGRYRFTVDVEPLTARDTNPANDLGEIVAMITPFRAITLDASRSAVSPFVATDDAQRRVQVTVRNEGNIDERDVRLSARLVELRGVPGLDGSLEEVEESPTLTELNIVVGRRTGEHEFVRVFDTEGLGLEAGKRYAILVQYDLGGSSVVPWWEGDNVPGLFEGVRPEEVGNGGLGLNQILDVSRDLGLCECLLLPFRVEESLFSQSHSASDASQFPDAFPADAPWTPRTAWNGEPVDADDPLGLPQWQQVAAGDVQGVAGIPASGQVWQLPAYQGVDDLEHTLESPVLPAHVVKATSRAFLDMRYASDLVDGQAVLEVRDMERTAEGTWQAARGVGGQWRPVDEARTQRVAVIIPPDYPQVIANNVTDSYGRPTGRTPSIPCYYDDGDQGNFNAQELAYLAKGTHLTRDDVRIANPIQGTSSGSLVTGGIEIGRLCKPFKGGLAFHDANGDGVFSPGETLYIDSDGSGTFTVGDIRLTGQSAGTVVTSTAGTGNPALRPARGMLRFDDAQDTGVFGPGDTLYYVDVEGTGLGRDVVSPGDVRLTAASAPSMPSFGSIVAASDGDVGRLLAAVVPPPPFYQQVPGQPDRWLAQDCKRDEGSPGQFCHWSPFPDFPAAGNAEWHAALNDTLRDLVARVGSENVGLFTTVTPDLRIGHQETATGAVYEVPRPGAEPLQFPIRTLDDLYLNLTDYGAIALLGDGLSRTFADQSSSLVRMAHGDDAADQERDPVYEEHFLRVFAILREAGDAGVSVIAAIGPAPATVAASGAAPPGLPMTVWQQPRIPADLDTDQVSLRFDFIGMVRVRCSAIDLSGTASGEAKHRTVMTTSERDRQTKIFCKHGGVLSPQGITIDGNQLRNYYFYASEDAQSLALRDFLIRNGIDFSHSLLSGEPGARPCLEHGARIYTPPSPPPPCIVPSPVMSSAHGSTTFITAPYASDTAEWVSAIVGNLTATGALPAGSGSWQHLPARLAAPFGGILDRDEAGNELFRGEPVQFRVRIQSDPVLGGHGSFAVDRIELLGTPNQHDVGVRFVEPRNEALYAPGSSFATLLSVANRGTEAADDVTVNLNIRQVGFCDGLAGSPSGQCTPLLSNCPGSQGRTTPLNVGTLLPGEVRAIRSTDLCRIGSLGRFPDKGSHPADADPPSQWAFQADLDLHPGFGDADATNDLHRVVALGRKVVDTPVTTVRLEPNAAPDAGAVGTVRAHIEVLNHGTQTDQVFVELTLHPVRLDGCRSPPPTRLILACYPPDHASEGERPNLPLVRAETLITVPRDGRATGRVDLPIAAAGIPPGTYRVQIAASAGAAIQAAPGPQWLHLVDPSVAPDQAKPFHAADLSPLAGGNVGLPAQTPENQEDPVFVTGGFSTDANGGACQPDGTTQADGQALVHGWWVTDQQGHSCGAPRDYLAMQWMRDARPTFDVASPPFYGANITTAEEQGHGDFGPDILYWHPSDERTNDVRSNEPVFTLATLQEPVLRLDARYHLTSGTAVAVEAQPALRECTGGDSASTRACSWTWPDEGNWFTLNGDVTRNALLNMAQTTLIKQDTQNPLIVTYSRVTNTNPLAGTHGIWGGDSLSGGGDGWRVIEYDLRAFQDWCDGLVTPAGMFPSTKFAPITEGCRFTNSNGDHRGSNIPVPIRFRIQAASYGGDAGINFFEVRELAITSHHVHFAGANVRSPIILDQPTAATATRLPLRIENTGPLHETLRITIQDAPGTTLFPGIDLQLGPTSAGPFDDELVVEVPAHSATVVWVRAHVAIELAESFAPGRDHPMPFLVRAESVLGDPTLRPEVFFDAKMRTRNWADLDAACFFLAEDDRCASVFPAQREVPVPVTVPITNRGRLDVDQPVLVRLYEEEISLDPATGDPTVLQRRVARDAAGAPSEAIIDAGIKSGRKQTELVDLEWNPPELGLYRLVAEVNLPHQGDPMDPIPETRLDNNVQSRFVSVGRVSLSDLHIEDARLVEFGTNKTVDRAVEGHNYRVVATVRNHGNAPALGPSLEFRVGSSSPFSFWNAAVFPGDGAVMEVQSSVWTAVGRQDGTPLRFLIGVTTQSPSASVDGKDLEFVMPVDRYGWRAEGQEREILLLPGTRSVVSFNVTNTGTAPGTPVVTSSHEGLQADLLAAPPVDPGKTARIDVALTTRPGLETDGDSIALTLFAREDRLRPIRLPADLVVLDLGTPQAHAFPLQAPPGQAVVNVVLDNPANIATRWTLHEASAPFSTIEKDQQLQVPAFGRVMENLTLRIDPHAAPGLHEATLQLLVGLQNTTAQVVVLVNATVHVLPKPLLEGSVGEPAAVRHGEPARVVIDLFNAGNVPLEARLNHTIDRGQMQVPEEGPFRIAPGQNRTVEVEVTEGKSTRVLGRTTVEWNGTNNPARTIDLPWQATFLGNSVRIVETDLDALKVTAGAIHRVRVTVENPSDQAVQAEVLVVVDGLLHDRTVLELAPRDTALAILPFQAGPVDQPQTVMVLVRPVDSTVGIADPAFYEVGDAVLREATPKDGDRRLPIPATGATAWLALAFAAILLARRRSP